MRRLIDVTAVEIEFEKYLSNRLLREYIISILADVRVLLGLSRCFEISNLHINV